MAPAFGLTAAKSLLPYFMDAVIKARRLGSCLILTTDLCHRPQMVDKWNDIIENGKSGNSADIDVNLWVGKATLDACVLILVLGRVLTVNSPLKGSALELSTTTSAP